MPFKVDVSGMEVKVLLGTHFNIMAYDEDLPLKLLCSKECVTVAEGNMGVEY